MSQVIVRCAAGLALALGMSTTLAQPGVAQSRGELLYTTHCTACHTTQMHWRDNRAATDWPSLKLQVRRWQGVLSLGWSDGDVAEVAAYLNQGIYRFEQRPDPQMSKAAAAASAPVIRP